MFRWMLLHLLAPFGGGISSQGGMVCAELSVTPAVEAAFGLEDC